MVLAAIALTNSLPIFLSTTSRNFFRTFRALLCKILVSAHFLQEFCGVPGHFCRKHHSAVQARSGNAGFSMCTVNRPQLRPHRLKPVLLKTSVHGSTIDDPG